MFVCLPQSCAVSTPLNMLPASAFSFPRHHLHPSYCQLSILITRLDAGCNKQETVRVAFDVIVALQFELHISLNMHSWTVDKLKPDVRTCEDYSRASIDVTL